MWFSRPISCKVSVASSDLTTSSVWASRPFGSILRGLEAPTKVTWALSSPSPLSSYLASFCTPRSWSCTMWARWPSYETWWRVHTLTMTNFPLKMAFSWQWPWLTMMMDASQLRTPHTARLRSCIMNGVSKMEKFSMMWECWRATLAPRRSLDFWRIKKTKTFRKKRSKVTQVTTRMRSGFSHRLSTRSKRGKRSSSASTATIWWYGATTTLKRPSRSPSHSICATLPTTKASFARRKSRFWSGLPANTWSYFTIRSGSTLRTSSKSRKFKSHASITSLSALKSGRQSPSSCNRRTWSCRTTTRSTWTNGPW